VTSGENRPSERISELRSRKFRRKSTIRKNFQNYIEGNFLEGRKEGKTTQGKYLQKRVKAPGEDATKSR
jgi:hypothetical protein